MSIWSKQQVRAKRVAFVEDRSVLGDTVVVFVFKNKNPVRFWGRGSLELSFVSVILLHEHSAIGRDCDSHLA